MGADYPLLDVTPAMEAGLAVTSGSLPTHSQFDVVVSATPEV
jgi:hypothetical protein